MALNPKEISPYFNFIPQAGKMQGFVFGKWLREKYPTLLKRYYDNNEIYAQSSKVTRCIMTVQTVLAGLYYPLDWADQWSGDFNINWTPIPVNSYDENLDHVSRYNDFIFKYTDGSRYWFIFHPSMGEILNFFNLNPKILSKS